jgi:hypothetical protein
MISDARRGHVSPGIYTEEKDVTYSVKSLGITSLGLVGETLYGPAFENIEIKNWSEFVDYFGGTSPEKFRGSGLPKYELPYIAKSYLEESKRLNVVRVLGLSGYHAGPYWGIKDASGNTIVVLRSKMSYDSNSDNICTSSNENPQPVVTGLTVGAYSEATFNSACEGTGSSSATSITGETYFKITVNTKEQTYTYNVNLEPTHPNYIYNVLSSRADGTTPIYVEAVFESARQGAINTSAISSGISGDVKTTMYFEITKTVSATTNSSTTYTYTLSDTTVDVAVNDVTSVNGLKENSTSFSSTTKITTKYVSSVIDVKEGVFDDYLEGYRAAQTPWIVSDATVTVENDKKTATMKKLFRFITISDGDAANVQVKVSIEKIDPKYGTFDVVVRDFNDNDSAPIVLERFTRCNLINGDAGYIAYKIGTSDGGFVAKSKYILVEMAEGEDLSNSVPAGFLGYAMPKYGDKVLDINYNVEFKPEIKAKKQYFGFSNLTGIDSDIFTYKGRFFYDKKEYTTKGFHMDSSIDSATTVCVDGVSGYNFTAVSANKVTADPYTPRIINAEYMNGTIYKDIKVRKFTVCFFGGFDGWDIHRDVRTNGDAYKASKYNISGSTVFSSIIDVNDELNLPLNLPSTAITTDYYAYLAGYRVFANPQDVDINLFATPGINWYDNTLLTEEAIDVIEDAEEGRGGDALYIMDAPASVDASELADAFAETEINSSYACTYSPWVMYYDASNKRYLDLPVTKDVVRNMAATDNNSYPWFAPAGMERGNVNCIKAQYKTTLANEDELYENRVNPVKTFAQDGVKIWGNKTAYNVESPLNRINVRRLMIRVKKLVTNAAKNLIFTQYDDTLEKQFRGLIDPILAEVKSNRGISDYRIITEVTPETKDQHILPAKILIKPTPALEYISISFVVYPESVSFDEN